MQELSLLMSRLLLTFKQIRSGPAYLEHEIELRRDYEVSIGFSRRLFLFLLILITYLIGDLKLTLLFQGYALESELFAPEDHLEYLHIIARVRGVNKNLRFFVVQQPSLSDRTHESLYKIQDLNIHFELFQTWMNSLPYLILWEESQEEDWLEEKELLYPAQLIHLL